MLVHIVTVRAVLSARILTTIAASRFNPDTFRHPVLSEKEIYDGCRLGIDTWADTSCSGKHLYVEEFIMGKYVTATGFTKELGQIDSLPLANVLYAYDKPDSEVVILELNNTIYLGDRMEDSLMNPIQCEEEDIRVDVRPSRYYTDSTAQSMVFPDGTRLPIEYHGVLPYIPIRRPTVDEVHTCRRLQLTSKDEWDPFLLSGSFSTMTMDVSGTSFIDAIQADPLGEELMSMQLPVLLDEFTYDVEESGTFCAVRTQKSGEYITPEEMATKLMIGLKTANRTLRATTSKFIRTTGSLTKRFRTDKAQLRYKQLSRIFG